VTEVDDQGAGEGLDVDSSEAVPPVALAGDLVHGGTMKRRPSTLRSALLIEFSVSARPGMAILHK
jgi:hypothetical protein